MDNYLLEIDKIPDFFVLDVQKLSRVRSIARNIIFLNLRSQRDDWEELKEIRKVIFDGYTKISRMPQEEITPQIRYVLGGIWEQIVILERLIENAFIKKCVNDIYKKDAEIYRHIFKELSDRLVWETSKIPENLFDELKFLHNNNLIDPYGSALLADSTDDHPWGEVVDHDLKGYFFIRLTELGRRVAQHFYKI